MRKKRLKTVAWLLLLCLPAGLFAGCGSKAPKLLEPIGGGDNLVTVKRGEMYNTTVSDTSVIPSVQYVRLEGQGVVAGLPVTVGDQVKEGDVLVEIDSAGVSGQVEELDQQIADMSADNEYLNNLAQIQIDIAEAELEQMKAAGADAADITEKTNDISKQRDKLYSDKIEQEKELAELQMQKMEGGISGSPLTAPCDGTVIALHAGNIGDVLESGIIAAVAEAGTKEIKGDYLEEEFLEQAHEYYALINGKRYEVTPSPYSQTELNMMGIMGGTLYSTYYLNEGEDVNYGEMAVVVVVTDYKENVLYIPDNALYSDVDGFYVYVQNKEGERERRDVETGFQWDSAVEITKGLEEGEVLYAK